MIDKFYKDAGMHELQPPDGIVAFVYGDIFNKIVDYLSGFDLEKIIKINPFSEKAALYQDEKRFEILGDAVYDWRKYIEPVQYLFYLDEIYKFRFYSDPLLRDSIQNQFFKDFIEYLAGVKVSYLFFKKYGDAAYVNCFKNASVGVSRLDVVSGCEGEAIILGAGPSLDKVLGFEPKDFNQHLVIIADSCMRFFKTHPEYHWDICCCCHAGRDKYLTNPSLSEGKILAYTMNANHEFVKNWRGSRVPFTAVSQKIYKHMNDNAWNIPIFRAGGSVANMVLAVCKHLGIKSVLSLGYDFGLVDGKDHFGDYPYTNELLPDKDKTYEVYRREFERDIYNYGMTLLKELPNPEKKPVFELNATKFDNLEKVYSELYNLCVEIECVLNQEDITLKEKIEKVEKIELFELLRPLLIKYQGDLHGNYTKYSDGWFEANCKIIGQEASKVKRWVSV